MHVEEGHDEEGAVVRSELVGLRDVGQGGRQVPVRQRDALRPACCTARVQKERHVVHLGWIL